MRKTELKVALICASSAFLLLQSCVNDDYDLNKDIDMTIQVGGNLELPVSTTEAMTMADILDLDDESIVQPNADNVYVLTKKADGSDFTFDLETVNVAEQSIAPFNLLFTLPTKAELLAEIGISESDFDTYKGISEELWPADFKNAIDKMHTSSPVSLEADVNALKYTLSMPNEVVALRYVGFDEMNPKIKLSTNIPQGTSLNLREVYADFPQDLKYKDTGEGAWDEVTESGVVISRYTLPESTTLTKQEGKNIAVAFSGMVCDYKKESQPDMKYNFNEDISMKGKVTISATGRQLLLGDAPLAGKSYKLTADIDLGEIVVGEVDAKVDPQIDNATSLIELNDLPDFLTEEGVTVLLQNPMIKLNVNSTAPVPVNCWGNILPKNKLGEALEGQNVTISAPKSDRIQIAANNITDYCIYDGAQPSLDGYKYYLAEGLGELIKTVPNTIDINFDAQVNQEFYKIRLGHRYNATLDYEVECPLAFQQGSQIVYADTIADWNKDIEDYEIETVDKNPDAGIKLTATVQNGTPLDQLDLDIIPIDKNGNEVEGIVVSPITNIHDGDNIEFTLQAERKGVVKQLDGVIMRVTAKVTKEKSAPLKSIDTIQLVNIKVSIVGGVIADLN